MITFADEIKAGYQGFPQCEVCQCYPECRRDCPKHLECVRRLPEYAERVFGSDKSTWPADVRAAWDERGYVTLAERFAALTPKRWWQFWT